MSLHNPLDLPVVNAAGFAPRHEVTDEDKAATIARDMQEHGWQGAPLVVLADYAQALTGVHRLAAAEEAGLTEVPAVELEDLLAAHGIDLWERREEFGDLDDAIEHLAAELPQDVQDAYGLDLR